MSLTADQLRGRVGTLIDGEKKFLRFDQSALAHLIDNLDVQGLSEIPSVVSTLDGETLKVLVWAGRLWEEPDLKIEDVGSWYYSLLPTYNSAIEALNLSLWGEVEPTFGGADDADVDPPIAAESGTSERHETLQ